MPSPVPDAVPDAVPDPLTGSRALARGLVGWLLLAAALGLAVGTAEVVDQRGTLTPVARQMLQAALVSAIVVPGIVWLRTRRDGRSMAGLGLSTRGGTAAALGLGVGLVSGVLAWAPALVAGWVRVEAVDLGTFVQFLALNGLVLALFEAVPEELALRGYTWTNLRDGWGTALATAVTTALFPVTAAVASVVSAGVTGLLGTEASPVTLVPGGDPVAYLLQLVLFGLALVAARRVPVRGALVVAVAFHWVQLTITRVVLGGTGWLDSGWDVTFVEPDAIALVLAHVVLAGGMFVVARRTLERRRA